jgi:class 3 adenylate cyclase/tetratricopeptide (TPR) repeat protein/ribosomal protein L40E
MRCSKCGTANPSANNFCAKCGNALAKACAKCNAENPPTSDFCGKCGTPLTNGADAAAVNSSQPGSASGVHVTPEQTSADAAALDGERKTVTALFADIKGSMELIEDLDPEEARAIVDPAIRLMIDAAHRYDGYVVQSTGDGIFALFGAPVAREDHPQRALYAALRMQEEVKRYAEKVRAEKGINLQVRVGVNTGEVVVRSIKTDDAHTEYTPIGHSTSLASRLQTLANPGSIAISEAVRKLVEGYFALKPLGPARIKGVSEPVDVYEVTGLGSLRTRLQRSAGRGLTKFVGREPEMEALKRAAEQARSGHGQILATMAEAGTGKSRLFYEFKVKNQSGWMVLEAFSVSHGKASAYLPVLALLQGYFKIAGEDDQRARRAKVTGNVLTLDRSLEDTLPYLSSLLGIVEGEDLLAQMDGQLKKRRTLEAIKRILLRESLNQPLMVIFEDLHWIDEATQELLNLLADSIGTAKLLLLVNYRPEYSHQWNSKTYYTRLRLDSLGKESADEMLSALLGDGVEVTALKRVIIEKTEGNPFFMEEAVQVLFDEGALVRDGAAVMLTRSLNTLKIPPTVQGILAARIDRLPPDAKDLLQALAVIGREFSQSLIRAVVPKPDDELNRLLNDLQLGEFIYEQPAVGDVEYIFKHALTQEVSYNSLLLERRKAIHERVGEAIETLNQSSVEEHLSELAHHYKQARNAAKAVHFLRRAADQAAARSALSEAETQLREAIAQARALPIPAERDLIELGLQTTLGAVLTGRSYGAQEKEEPLQRACELCDRVTDPGAVLSALFQIVQFNIARMRLNEARALAERATRLVQTIEDPLLAIGAWHNLGETLWWAGEPLSARTYLDQTLALYEKVPRLTLIASFGVDWWIVTALSVGLTHLILGSVDQAFDWAVRTAERVRDSTHPLTKCMGLVAAAYPVTFGFGDLDWIRRLLAPARQLAEEYGFAEMLGYSLQFDAYARFWQGERSAALEQMIDAIARLDAVGSSYSSTWRLAALAEMYLELGDYRAAEETVSGAINLVNRTNERFCEPEVHRVAAEIIFRKPGGDLVAAEERFREAITIAHKQSAKWWELRASKSLARLLAKQGKRDEARTMLGEIYNWFTEGFDTADLKDAKTLLDELTA